VSGFILGANDAATIERFAGEVAPATRELLAAECARHSASRVRLEHKRSEDQNVGGEAE
jgi:hypothetical protein